MQLNVPMKRLAFVLALSAASLAQAASFSSTIDVSLLAPGGITSDGINIDPTPLDFLQSVSPSGQILPGIGGAISGFMLPLESITISGTSILVRVAEGASNGTTGYLGAGGQHARYVFDNLGVNGQTITGLAFSAFDNFAPSGFVGVDNLPTLNNHNAIRLLSPHSVVLELDEIHFVDRGQGQSNNFADFRIDIQTAPVPEPASGALALVGLLSLGLARKLRRN